MKTFFATNVSVHLNYILCSDVTSFVTIVFNIKCIPRYDVILKTFLHQWEHPILSKLNSSAH